MAPRVVGRGRGQREDLAGRRVEHHDRAAVVARARRRPPAGAAGRASSAGRAASRRDASNLSSSPPNGSDAAEADELRVVRALEARRPVLARRVADDVADRVVAVLADRLAVLVARAAGEPAAVAVDDRAAERAAGDRDDRRVVGRARQALGLDDLPPAGADREDRERRGERDAGAPDVAADRAPAGGRRSRVAARRSARRRTTRRSAGRRRPSRSRGPGGALDARIGQREQQPDDERVREQRRAAVRDERQRDARCSGISLRLPAAMMNAWTPTTSAEAGGEQRAEVVVPPRPRSAGRARPRPGTARGSRAARSGRAPRPGPRAGSRCGPPESAGRRRSSAARRRGRPRAARRARRRTAPGSPGSPAPCGSRNGSSQLSTRVWTWPNRLYRTDDPAMNRTRPPIDVARAPGRHVQHREEHREEQQRRAEIALHDDDHERDRPHRDHRGEVRERRQPHRPDAGALVDEERTVLGQVAGQEHDEDDLQELRRLAGQGPIERVSRAPLTSLPKTNVSSSSAIPIAAHVYL